MHYGEIRWPKSYWNTNLKKTTARHTIFSGISSSFPLLWHTNMGQMAIQMQEIFPKRRPEKKKNIQYLCCPLPSPETMRMVLVYYWKNRGLKEFSLFLWLHQICILIIGKGQVDHSPSPPLQHRQVGIPYAKQTVHVFPACYTPACQVNPEWNREPASSSL